jgi:glucose dehydrogenase
MASTRKVLMQAPKNGFFYVLDRQTGKLISAEKLGKVTWADHIDLATGRPVENPNIRYERASPSSIRSIRDCTAGCAWRTVRDRAGLCADHANGDAFASRRAG